MFAIALIVVVACGHVSCGQRAKDRMYEEIDGVSACIRRLNGTNQFGCTSDRAGTTGVLHYVESPADLAYVLTELAGNGLHYVPAVPVSLFGRDLNDLVHAAAHIAGVLVYEANETLAAFSPDERCPNAAANVAGTCAAPGWNPHGSGLLREDIRYPVFYVHSPAAVERVRACFAAFNNFSFQQHAGRALCAIEMQSFMFAAKDTPTCLRRSQSMVNFNPMKFCDALGDQNVWTSLFPIGNSSQAGVQLPATLRHILVVVRMDATSLFHGLDPGAQSTVTSLVTLIAVADLLKRMLPTYEAYERNVLFVVFNGESYDYIGSQRFVYDMQSGVFPQRAFDDGNEQVRPLRMDDVAVVLELSQLANMPHGGQLHLHQLAENGSIQLADLLNGTLELATTQVGRLPPTSVQSFAREANAPPLLVLSSYNESFTNAFFNGIYDTAAQLHYTYANMSEAEMLPKDSIQTYLATIADGVARALFQAVTGSAYPGSHHADLFRINELLHCYLENANCSIHRTVRRASFQRAPLDLDVGVGVQPNAISNLVALTLAYVLADVTDAPCGPSLQSHVFYHFNMSADWSDANQTRCYRASMNLTAAESPAFLLDDYDWASGRYSTWSESVWREFRVRLFLQPARSHEVMTITVGAVVCAIALAAVLFVNARKDALFSESATVTPPTHC